MLLSELTTPYERLPVYVYASDNNSAVLKRQRLQHISGAAYKDEERKDKYGQSYCRIYAYYPELNIGFWLGGISNPQLRRVDEIEKMLVANCAETPEQHIDMMEKELQGDGYIRNLQIAFARIAAPERADVYAASRLAYLKMRDERIAKAVEQKKAEDEAYCQEKKRKMQAAIDEAVNTIRNGGTLHNKKITLYRGRYDSSTYSLINYLSRLYDVPFPLKVQGWVNEHLGFVVIQNSKAESYTSRKNHRSATFFAYMDKLIAAICAEDETKKEVA